MKTSLKSCLKWVAPVLMYSLAVVPAAATSLWDEECNGGQSLFGDRKAFRRGDLVTIIVNLDSKASKDQSTETSKAVSELERFKALIGPFMGGVRTTAELDRREPHNQWSGTRTYAGSGKIKHDESLTSTIQARVTDVLPNKVLRVEASRKAEIDQETSYLVLTGLVRQEDLTTANTVNSTQVAELQIKQVGQGTISREQHKGWLTRVWETISPF